eukprot:GFYU01007683.1.p1 GENE.GFYU01007683.1~~GFYU01007683.1.p1  ORF type:complete len:413 (+),score=29.22 GFYU01007683.1:250-1488(+)
MGNSSSRRARRAQSVQYRAQVTTAANRNSAPGPTVARASSFSGNTQAQQAPSRSSSVTAISSTPCCSICSGCNPAVRNCLHRACLEGDTGRMNELLAHNSNLLYSTGMSQCTPIHVAAAAGRFEAVKMLTSQFSSRVDLRDEDGRTPIHLAAGLLDSKILQFLLLHWATLRAMSMSTGAEDTIDELQDRHGDTPLHIASTYGCLENVQALLDNGWNEHCLNRNGETPVHLASYAGKYEVVSVLIMGAHGLDACYHKDVLGRTPLDCAIHTGRHQIVEMLLDFTTNAHATSHTVTPLTPPPPSRVPPQAPGPAGSRDSTGRRPLSTIFTATFGVPGPAGGKRGGTSTSHGPAQSVPPQEEEECCICLNEKTGSIFAPCGHNSACAQCARTLFESTRVCPICRAPISHVVYPSV